MTGIEDIKKAFRRYLVDGVPASGANKPEKSEINAAFDQLGVDIGNIAAVAGMGALVDVIKTTKSNLDADLAHGANTIALVYADGSTPNNDLYVKSGGSGSGAWTNTGALHGIMDTLASPYVEDAEAARDAAVAAQRSSIPRVMIAGDSIMAQNHQPSGGVAFGITDGKGEFTWAHAQYPYFEMDQWFDPDDSAQSQYSKGCNEAVGASTTADLLARLPTSALLAADIWCISTGINDINNGATAAAAMTNLEAICAYGSSLGKTILLANLRPVAASYNVSGVDWSNGSARMVQWAALNSAIASFCATATNVHFVDLLSAYSNGASPPRPRTEDTYDGLHPTRSGAFRGAQAWLAVLRRIIKPLVKDKPTGPSLITGTDMAGTTGTKGTGVTGDVATHWDVVRWGGAATMVASKNGAGKQQIVITPSGVDEGVTIQRASGSSGMTFENGKWYKGWARVRLHASPYWAGVYWQADGDMMGMGYPNDAAGALFGGPVLPTNADIVLDIQTPVHEGGVGSEGGEVVMRAAWDATAVGTLTITIEEIGAYEVPDPNPLHGFDA